MMKYRKRAKNHANTADCRPTLRLSPTAWSKLLFLRDRGETEVGGFGISTDDDLLYVENIELIPQVCSGASVRFEDQGVADFFDRQVDRGRQPEQFARIWIHTHPGRSAQPSFVDEDTFERVFGRTAWAAMFILARQGQTYARLRFAAGPGGAMRVPVRVDYSRPFLASDQADWQAEYAACVRPAQPRMARIDKIGLSADATTIANPADDDSFWDWDERLFMEQLSAEVGHGR